MEMRLKGFPGKARAFSESRSMAGKIQVGSPVIRLDV